MGRRLNIVSVKFSDNELKEIDEKEIRIVYLPSTSPANAKCSLSSLVESFRELFEYN